MTTLFSSNTSASQVITEATIQQQMDEARTGYAFAKDGANKAAANLYMTWLAAVSDDADINIKKWFRELVDTENKKIDTHNKKIDSEKAYAKRVKDNQLKDEDPLKKEPKDEAERTEQAADRERLTELADNADYWRKRKMVRIELLSNEFDTQIEDLDSKTQVLKPQFAAVARFALQLFEASMTPTVSRYATVMCWIHKHYNQQAPIDADEIVIAITTAGSFEAVLNEYRDNSPVTVQGLTDQEIKARHTAIVEAVNGAILSAPSKGIAKIAIEDATDGIVALLGRVANDNVEIVGQLPIPKEELEATIAQVRDGALLPTYPAADFVAQVMTLGELVPAGAKTDKKIDGLKSGAPLKEVRVVSLVPHDSSGLQVVVSSMHGSASVVVKATPKDSRMQLGTVGAAIMLPDDQSDQLKEVVAERTDRLLVDIIAKTDGSSFAWEATDHALATHGSPAAANSFGFEDLAAKPHKPLDIDGFKPQFSVAVTTSGLRGFYKASLEAWKKHKASNKAKELMVLTFGNGKVTYTVKDQDAFDITHQGEITGVHTLKFRANDLVALVEALIATNASTYTLKGDTAGMLSVSFENALGTFEIYQPTATADGTLNPKRLEPMRCDVAVPHAA